MLNTGIKGSASEIVTNEKTAEFCKVAHHCRGAGRNGRDDGGQEHAAPRHTRLRQDLRVDDDDVSHREERGQAGQNLSRDGRAVFLQMEELLHLLSTSLGLCGAAHRVHNAAAGPGENCDSP